MAQNELHVVTGAFGYSGKRIAAGLIEAGHRVRTLTNSPGRPNPFGPKVEVCGYHFDDPAKLGESLRGAAVLYNTYWVRFDLRGHFNQAEAVENSKKLFAAARAAGVRRVVHVSITNPSEDSPLAYFRCKALLERALIESGLSYAILRPAVLFGGEDILVNNIAWTLRRLPVFAMFGRGRYRLRPIHVDDLAALAVAQGAARENRLIDAVGPEGFEFRDLVKAIARILGKRRLIVPMPPWAAFAGAWLTGKIMGDVMLTRAEVCGLMANLLDSDAPPAGPTRLTDWARANASVLGVRYASELARRKDRTRAYAGVEGL
ncbi:MAG: NAD(P)H-binding protein [Planctomycetota bacterium]|nr:NAD(P)H-binding protein [Planctomycetota bacterium]